VTEQVHDVGYVNEERKHLLISISEPTMCVPFNVEFVQIVITIETAMELRAQLDAFLIKHGATLQ